MRLYIIYVCTRLYFAFKSNRVRITYTEKNPIFRRKIRNRNRFYSFSGPPYSPRWSLAKFYYPEHGARQPFMCASSYNIIQYYYLYSLYDNILLYLYIITVRTRPAAKSSSCRYAQTFYASYYCRIGRFDWTYTS